jgi:hypothetical protein
MSISTALRDCIVGQTFGLEWLAVGGNAVEGLGKQTLREEQGTYKISQAICHDLVSYQSDLRFNIEYWKHTGRLGKR